MNDKNVVVLMMFLFVLFVWEGNVDFRDVVGRVRWRVWVWEYGLFIMVNDKDIGVVVGMSCFDCKVMSVFDGVSSVVVRREGVFLELVVMVYMMKDEENRNEDKG